MKKTRKPKNCGIDVPARDERPARFPAAWRSTSVEPEGARRQDHPGGGRRHRELVGDDLRARADPAHERELAVRGPAREHDGVHRERRDREDVQDADREVGAEHRDLAAGDLDGSSRRGRPRRSRGPRRPRWPARAGRGSWSALVRRDRFLEEHLDHVGDRLDEAEGPDAVGPGPVLDERRPAPLEPGQGHDEEGKDQHGQGHAQDHDHPVEQGHSVPAHAKSPFFSSAPPSSSCALTAP